MMTFVKRSEMEGKRSCCVDPFQTAHLIVHGDARFPTLSMWIGIIPIECR